jgi:reductive dehalogenase
MLLVASIILFTGFAYFGITFLHESEKRASLVAFISGVIITAPLFFVWLIFSNDTLLQVTFILVYLIVGIVMILPIRNNQFKQTSYPKKRFDERQIMFSRSELIVDSERFVEYYKNNPEHKTLDDKFRSKPGLLSKKSQKYHPLKFASAHANFEAVHLFVPTINEIGNKAEKIEINPVDLSNYIKKWALQLGVVNVGITELNKNHFYSVKGRGEKYGQKIENKQKYAIAFTVEMSKEMMDMAPEAETVLESSQQYLNGANIAAQLTLFIRNLGYSAKPHFDGNYEVICPLVARDAGLGEFGRMGLLMTPQLGPRVRVGVVTTDVPLITDSYKVDYSVFDFCTKCKKCADNCPSRAISLKKMKEEDGVLRWTINHEACFTYWTIVGTDCGKCVQVCPYSHPSNFMHNLIRKGIKNSSLFASFALKMDDLFYGRKPGNKHYTSPLD